MARECKGVRTAVLKSLERYPGLILICTCVHKR